MVLRTDIGQQEGFFHRITVPFVVACRTHVSTVVARVVVVVSSGSRCFHLLVLTEGIVLALHTSLGMSGRQVPCHPVGQLRLLVVAHDVALPLQYLLRHTFDACRLFHRFGHLRPLRLRAAFRCCRYKRVYLPLGFRATLFAAGGQQQHSCQCSEKNTIPCHNFFCFALQSYGFLATTTIKIRKNIYNHKSLAACFNEVGEGAASENVRWLPPWIERVLLFLFLQRDDNPVFLLAVYGFLHLHAFDVVGTKAAQRCYVHLLAINHNHIVFPLVFQI